MPEYRRLFVPGGTYFFTLCLADRRADTLVRHVDALRAAYRKCVVAAPVETLAICILPDHLHMVWRLPDGDHDFSSRIGQFKGAFTRALPDTAKQEGRKRERGIWQQRFWEHAIRDETDLENHVNYIHFNPVRHGHVRDMDEWPWSSWHRFKRDYGQAWKPPPAMRAE